MRVFLSLTRFPTCVQDNNTSTVAYACNVMYREKSIYEAVTPIVSPKRTVQNTMVDRDVHAELTVRVFACLFVHADVYNMSSCMLSNKAPTRAFQQTNGRI